MISEQEIAKIAKDDARRSGTVKPPLHYGEAERNLYWQLYFMCRRFLIKDITAEQAKAMKAEYIESYLSRSDRTETAVDKFNKAMICGDTVRHTHLGITCAYRIRGIITRYDSDKGWWYSLELVDKAGCIVYATLEDTEIEEERWAAKT